MTAIEKLAREIAEKMRIQIHWSGEPNDDPHDVKWLASVVGQDVSCIMPIITRHLAAALKERDERLRQRLRRAQSMLELDDPISRSTVRVAIREALRELGEGGSDE